MCSNLEIVFGGIAQSQDCVICLLNLGIHCINGLMSKLLPTVVTAQLVCFLHPAPTQEKEVVVEELSLTLDAPSSC